VGEVIVPVVTTIVGALVIGAVLVIGPMIVGGAMIVAAVIGPAVVRAMLVHARLAPLRMLGVEIAHPAAEVAHAAEMTAAPEMAPAAKVPAPTARVGVGRQAESSDGDRCGERESGAADHEFPPEICHLAPARLPAMNGWDSEEGLTRRQRRGATSGQRKQSLHGDGASVGVQATTRQELAIRP
jgi:hypothetical protein